MKVSGAEIIVKMLEANDASYIFGVPGGHLLKFYDAVYNSKKLTPILTKHESGAAFIAAGFSEVSNEIGVCTGTVGPGATNLITGIASAYMDSIPIFVLTAQVGTSTVGKGGLQEATGVGRTIDHVELFDGITKYSNRALNVNKLPESFRNLIRLALNGRQGPVHLDVMADILASYTEVDNKILNEKIEKLSISAIQKDIDRASKLVFFSKNPAILAGAGARAASKEILKLVENYNIPLATTIRGKGIIPENHEFYLGCLGLYGINIANKYLRSGIDVLIGIGTSFSEFTTHAWDKRFQPSDALIQIDIDGWEISKNYATEIGIKGDSDIVL
ncbi:MAG: thiamine pyrophosphate-binding protein [Actinomycetota bacterium]